MPRSPLLKRTVQGRREPDASRSRLQAIAATAELCGQALSEVAAEMLVQDLAGVHDAALIAALARCRLELRGALHLGEILARIEDGRPAVEEAWSRLPASEAQSVVWTAEMAQAWQAAAALLQQGDTAAAYAAFRDAYTQAVLIARCKREPVAWSASLGSDPIHRERVLREAMHTERLPASYVESLLPYRSLSPQAKHLLKQVHIKNMTDKT